LESPPLRKKKNNKFRKKELFVIEPVRLSRKNNKQFFKYKMMGFSLIHKNKRKIYKKYSENRVWWVRELITCRKGVSTLQRSS